MANFKEESGTILIITLWILAILTVLSVGVAGRMGLELKLTGLYRDNMKVLYLTKAAIERVIAEKEKDETQDADILNEPWANDEDLFNNYKIDETGNLSYTIKYKYKETRDSAGTELYGMMDEASKININKIVTGDDVDDARKEQLVSLLEIVCELSDAREKINALIDWMDTNGTVQGPGGEEVYSDTGVASYCKNRPLDLIEELLLIKGFDSTILYGDEEQEKHGIIDCITIYTEDGLVNVNTAPKEVLEALGFKTDYVTAIMDYRRGTAEELGKEGNKAITGFEELISIIDLPPEELDTFNNTIKPYLSLTSTTFRINAYGKVNRAGKHIECVATLKDGKYEIEYWNEQ